jgi:hypothetical protein
MDAQLADCRLGLEAQQATNGQKRCNKPYCAISVTVRRDEQPDLPGHTLGKDLGNRGSPLGRDAHRAPRADHEEWIGPSAS